MYMAIAGYKALRKVQLILSNVKLFIAIPNAIKLLIC